MRTSVCATWSLERMRDGRACQRAPQQSARRATPRHLRAPRRRYLRSTPLVHLPSTVNWLDKRADGTTTLALDVDATPHDRTTASCGVSDVLAPLAPTRQSHHLSCQACPSSTAIPTRRAHNHTSASDLDALPSQATSIHAFVHSIVVSVSHSECFHSSTVDWRRAGTLGLSFLAG